MDCRLWQRWECSAEECPGQPGWDVALAEQSGEAVNAYREEALLLIRRRMTEFAATFQREHPEAVLREDVPVT